MLLLTIIVTPFSLKIIESSFQEQLTYNAYSRSQYEMIWGIFEYCFWL